MINFSTQELYCGACGKTAPYPICCTKEMQLDGDIFFCEICGRERPVPQCCGAPMAVREKETVL